MKCCDVKGQPHVDRRLLGGAVAGAIGILCVLQSVAQGIGVSTRSGAERKSSEPTTSLIEGRPLEGSPSIGTADPILLRAIAPDGRWAFVCQDRDPDSHRKDRTVGIHGETFGLDLRPYLIVSAGPGFPIDEFVESDPTGRFIAARVDGRFTLIDTKTVRVTALVVAKGPGNRLAIEHLTAFDAKGHHMLYERQSRQSYQLVVRELDSGRESITEAGTKPIRRAQLTSNGRWIIAEISEEDDSVRTVTDLTVAACRGPQASYFSSGVGGSSRLTRAWARVGESHMHETPGLIRPVNGALLVRDSEGSIIRVSSTGKEVRVPRGCGGRVIYSDDDGQRILAVCAGQSARTGVLTEFDGNRSFDLGVAPVPQEDLGIGADGNIVQWEGFTIDTVKHADVPIPTMGPGAVVMVVHGVLLRRRGVYAIRGDGAELTASEISSAPENSIPMGPLRWLKPVNQPSKPMRTNNSGDPGRR